MSDKDRPSTADNANTPRVEHLSHDEELDKLEQQLRAHPTSHVVASRYRERCAAYGRHDRSIAFLEGLLAAHPEQDEIRLELANAYIDKIPTCTGLMAFTRRGVLARKSLDQLDPIVTRDRNSWIAHYCRAMNHLYWPRLLGHTTDAIEDFARCIELQQPDIPLEQMPHHVLAYIGLGDAYAKRKEYEKARQVWRDGLKRFPQSEGLQERLQVEGNSALHAFVKMRRSLNTPVDTNLSFLDDAPGRTEAGISEASSSTAPHQ
ncbi:MAG: tetratricopeptide repeat protein [Phycisphaerae bacterium]